MINFLAGITVTTGQVGGAEAGRDELWVPAPNTTVSTLVIHQVKYFCTYIQIFSSLQMFQTRQTHAGNYTCAPPHATSDTVRLYVAQGKIFLYFSTNIFIFTNGSYTIAAYNSNVRMSLQQLCQWSPPQQPRETF